MVSYNLNTQVSINWGDDYINVKGPKGIIIKKKSDFSLAIKNSKLYLWSIENSKKEAAYPLGTTSYGLAYTSGKNAAKQAAVAEWFTYILDKCATKYPEKGFAQITGPLATKAKEQIAKIK